jgi:hypothetical protein
VLAVDPGLALDGAGRELFLGRTACVDLGQWFEQNQCDPSFGFADTANGDGGKTFGLSVVACFRACPDRPVPAIASSCVGTGADTAFSRIAETAELLLRPRPFAAAPPPYPRLRILFQIAPDDPQFDDVRLAREAILALAAADQPAALLAALRKYGALDEIARAPEDKDGRRSLYPEEPGCVLLADLPNVIVKPTADGHWALATPAPAIDVGVRRALVDTATIQELLCGPRPPVAAGGPTPPPVDPDAGGPRIDPTSVTVDVKKITFTFGTDDAVAAASVAPEAVRVTAFDDDDGWYDVDVRRVTYDDGAKTATVDLKEKLDVTARLRLVVRGTGPRPVLGANGVPLAGAAGGPPVSVDGRDFVFMKEGT